MLRLLLFIILSSPLLLGELLAAEHRPATQQHIPVLTIKGAIGPAVSDYIAKEISRANQQAQASAIILIIDTPGGLSSSLRDINQRILDSDIPLLCLVFPQGARAASAGTYILYACHVAAMSSATTLGAATPVNIAGGFSPKQQDKEASRQKSAMEIKVLNDAIAYIRSLAQLRGRNVKWAELAVSEGATLSAKEALEKNVIDYLVESPEKLLQVLDGKTIIVKQQEYPLQLAGAQLVYRQPDWRSKFIATITDPNIAYLLMLIGIYGLLLEFYSPGIGIAGVTGAISLFIALYAFQLLPINYAGFALLLLGISLLIVESMIPSFGVFGMGGLVAFILGSIFLIDTDQQQFQVSLTLIFSLAIASGSFIVFILGYIWRMRSNQVVSGLAALIGAQGTVLEDFTPEGVILLKGEHWAAISTEPLKQGQLVTVNSFTGLTVSVTRSSEPQKK
ncbi:MULTISPECIES: NfeD family protein [Colwellia]|uniref:Serine protease n=1 Tax=Colwellia marinimaniae TaxID=1513592 RepID=A0ABQ0MV56_9GAMM|nr:MULTISPECIES: nodulation protein NfeD [Colwellia]GAW96244.1 serine protease [Colwellia marinimaniae]